jgi:hypothetical protein
MLPFSAHWNSNVTKKISIIKNDTILLFCLFSFGIASWTLYCRAFIWDDSYFYLVVARNIVLTHQQTFSHIFPTNGFHPLWLYVLTAYSYVVSLINPDYLFNTSYAIPLSALFVALGCLNFIKVATLLNLPVFIFTGIPLAYVLFFPVLYSEAHMYYFALSLLTLIAVNKPQKHLLIGIICGVVFLSRLDSIFIILSYFLFYYVVGRRFQGMIRYLSSFMVVVAPYLISNMALFGGLMPISGWMKSSFPVLFFQKTFWSINSFLEYNVIAGILPMLFAGVVLIRRYAGSQNRLFYVYCVGSLLHFLYTAFFTRFHTIYWWYYVPNIILLGFASAIFLTRTLRTISYNAVFKIVFLCLFCAALVAGRWGKTFPDRKLQDSVQQILNYISQHKIMNTTILMSDVPGVIAFFSLNNIIAADMLTANRTYFEKLRGSANALEFTFAYCEALKKPIQYVILFDNVSSKFMELDRLHGSIHYYDPKWYPVKKNIGQMDIPRKPDFITADKGVLVWKVADRNFCFPATKHCSHNSAAASD